MNILISRENSQFSRKIKTFISRCFCHLTNFFQHHLRRCFCHAKKEIMTALIMYTIHSVPEPMMMEWVSFKLLDTLTPTLSGRRKIWKSKRDYWSKPFWRSEFFFYFNQKNLGGPGGAALLPGSDASLTTTSLLLKQSLRPPVQGRNSHCHALIWNLQFHTRKIQESVNVLIKIVGLHNLVQFLGGTQVTAAGSLISL